MLANAMKFKIKLVTIFFAKSTKNVVYISTYLKYHWSNFPLYRSTVNCSVNLQINYIKSLKKKFIDSVLYK